MTFEPKLTDIKRDNPVQSECCYHCGENCDKAISEKDKYFCCSGCRQVFLLLEENNLCSYYQLDQSPGIKAKGRFTNGRFAYLSDPSVIRQLVQFSDDRQINITFSIPQIHCSSCVYLLENLHRLDPGIIVSRTNFHRKEIFISFDPLQISLQKVVELLAFTGYEPVISLNEVDEKDQPATKKLISNQRNQIYKIGVAGFCFANIMMLSFPEYFSSGHIDEKGLKAIFTWLNFFLSIPVLVFSASGIFSSAWKGLRQRYINIDLPIALAIIVTFARSYYEIISGYGVGYLDSGCGIIFFMLIGRWFQNKTNDSLSFDRDYRSYFPLGVTIIEGETEKNIPVTRLKKGDHVVIRNEEMIPADSILLKGTGNIDYSFVTGENTSVQKNIGELVHAGGRQCGHGIELRIVKNVSQSYITELWNNENFSVAKNKNESFIHPWSRYFTVALLSIAFATFITWWIINPANILPAVTAVLIVACPCSLLLSATFTYGNMLRIFGKCKCYLKNANVIESLAMVDTVVFDKTGTITLPNESSVSYEGNELSKNEKKAVFSVSRQSSHPLSRILAGHLIKEVKEGLAVESFEETAGMGLSAMVNNVPVKIGAGDFTGNSTNAPVIQSSAHVYINIGSELKGNFRIGNQYRKGIHRCISALKKNGYTLQVLSGDNQSEEENLRNIFGPDTNLKFRQKPLEKLETIKQLQASHKKVLMIGDGLNDSGALKQADVGISISNNNAHFTPACDAILAGERVVDLSKFLKYARSGKKIVIASFIISIAYNIIGLYFAATAMLSPMVAAILMPASSITIVMFVTLATTLLAKKYQLSNL